jgi:negative modulator of initiation of replication
MKTIQINDSTYQALLAHVQDFGETPNDVISRLLNIKTEKEVNAPESRQENSEVEDFCDTIAGRKRSGIGRYLMVLEYLYKANTNKFERAIYAVHGPGRLYISTSISEIKQSGNSTKPKSIEGTPYFAVTNLSKPLMQRILRKLMWALEYDERDAQAVCLLITRPFLLPF